MEQTRDYIDAAAMLHHPTTYTWVHLLGDIVSGLLHAGVALDWLHGARWYAMSPLRGADPQR